MSSKPPRQDPEPSPVTVTGADQAQENRDARNAERKRFDWSRTILRPGGGSSLPTGTRSTLA